MKSERNRALLVFQVVFVSVLVLVCCEAVYAQTTGINTNVEMQAEPLRITQGESEILNTEKPTVRVAVTDPAIAEVKVLTPYQVMVQGLKVGSTDLIVWGENETDVQRWKVRVVLDVESYKKQLQGMFPDGQLEVSEAGETLMIKGLLRNTNQTEQLHDYLTKDGVKYVDMTSVSGVQQVQLDVRVAEVSRQMLRSLGVNILFSGHDFFGLSAPTPSSGTPLISDVTIGQDIGTATASSSVNIIAGFPDADLQFFLNALVENQYMKVLANPTLVAANGETASFLAGGEYPIPVVQGTASESITIEYREYGVRLTFRPIVLGDGAIRLYVAPEVSELTEVGGVVISGFSVPALLSRRFETTLELNSGQTFIMAGLIKQNIEALKAQIPGLGDLPVLGPLFSSIRYIRNDTELAVFVTASLVEPMSMDRMSPLPGFLHVEPSDWEVYLETRIESKKPATISPADAARLKELGLDNLVGPGAWESSSM